MKNCTNCIKTTREEFVRDALLNYHDKRVINIIADNYMSVIDEMTCYPSDGDKCLGFDIRAYYYDLKTKTCNEIYLWPDEGELTEDILNQAYDDIIELINNKVTEVNINVKQD